MFDFAGVDCCVWLEEVPAERGGPLGASGMWEDEERCSCVGVCDVNAIG